MSAGDDPGGDPHARDHSGGLHSGGSHSGDPDSGGPHSGDPDSGGLHSGGLHSGDLDSGGPHSGDPHARDLHCRVLLTRVIEPGDETGGRWLREYGVREVARRLRDGGEPLPGVSGTRWAGLVARAAQAEPRRDLDIARDAGVRFVCPGDFNFCGHMLCCRRTCCSGEVLCCGRVVAQLDG
ncbi:hypothetical protein AB0I54_26910 [Streptomyces sp. NPDC050625]|uniref:hypothetical protein n=1 Tax=Streptomyces sp. NPDC050625 TaxID=3154629 RepID=UPI00343A657D